MLTILNKHTSNKSASLHQPSPKQILTIIPEQTLGSVVPVVEPSRYKDRYSRRDQYSLKDSEKVCWMRINEMRRRA